MTVITGFTDDDPQTTEPQGARAQLAALLVDALDESVKVVGYAEAITPEPDHDVVVIALDEVTPSRYSGARTVRISLLVAVAKTGVGAADDALEVHLGAVLDALDEIAWVDWKSAKRSIYAPSEDSPGFPAFSIDIEIEVH